MVSGHLPEKRRQICFPN